jgi:hypothetical protein
MMMMIKANIKRGRKEYPLFATSEKKENMSKFVNFLLLVTHAVMGCSLFWFDCLLA